MIITIDTETQGLDATRFLMGVIIDHNNNAHHYDNKDDMRAHIQRLAEQCKKKKRCLLIYAHNMAYDYYALHHGVEAQHHYTYSTNPFIVDQREDNQIYAKWLSTTSLWRGTLNDIGTALNMPKGETPAWLKQDDAYTPTPHEWEEAHTYMEQDARIVRHFITTISERLEEQHIKPRWILTSSQIGINYFMKELRKNAHIHFENYTRGQLPRPRDPERIHQALRGGRIQALHTGIYEHASNIDINSHYPASLATMRVPDLTTQRAWQHPLQSWGLQDYLSTIGISHALVEVGETPYGVLPVRIDSEHTEYPNTPGQLLIGTWTHLELQAAHERGWHIIDIAWGYTWEDLPVNPFREIIHTLYNHKLAATNEMDKFFYKMLLNGAIGKFAQRRETYDYHWDNIENEHVWLKEGYVPIEVMGVERLYAKCIGTTYPPYYAPIWNAYCTATARVSLLKSMERIPPTHLYYVDTDSIIADDTKIKEAKFKYSRTLGDWKDVTTDGTIHIYAKKAYRINNDIKLSGVGKNWINIDDFEHGIITYKRMLTEGNTPHKERYGTFTSITINLHTTQEQHHTFINDISNKSIIIDEKNTDSTLIDRAAQWMESKESTRSSPSSS